MFKMMISTLNKKITDKDLEISQLHKYINEFD